MFIGVPGSGKTYFATQLAQQLRGVRLGGDAMRLAIFGSLEAIDETYHSPHRERVNTYTFGAIDYVTRELLRSGVPVVYDAIHTKRADRIKQEAVAREFDALPVLVHIETPHEVAAERGQSREASPDQRKFEAGKMREVIAHFADTLEPPEPNENVITIDGQLPFEQQYRQFTDYIATLP